jgi:fumarate reductase flavoprotein subunit
MWDDAGIVRDASGLGRAQSTLAALGAEHQRYTLPPGGRDRAFNVAWHDWLNLGHLLEVSRAITCAALARENSRGAHYRSDFPDPGALARSSYTRVRLQPWGLASELIPVRFNRVRPGDSLLPR